ncbi:MAG: DUF1624 domain-containing protein [Candidatus Aenigmarchaeota archaeon]|nr:DUF1624 domain-containing protein [Candidatus Aenigmarchaeota archaeon]
MQRFWEIDFFRGLAIVLMVLFNYAFTLDYFHIYAAAEGWLFWWLFPRIVAGMFIFIAGVALTISYSRRKNKQHHTKRGLKVFGWGLIITAVTWAFAPAVTVWFGVLHFIGLSIILSLLFVKLKPGRILVVASIFLIVGIYLNSLAFDFPWLLWLGLTPSSFSTLDYFPLFPWFGIFAIGMALGKKLYRNGKRRFKIRKELFAPLNFLGRHSLFIYLLHQPVLLGALYVLGLF